MTQTQTLLRTSAETAKEFEDAGIITSRELRALLNAVALLKQGGGWGEIEMIYKNHDLNDVNIMLRQKPIKDV